MAKIYNLEYQTFIYNLEENGEPINRECHTEEPLSDDILE